MHKELSKPIRVVCFASGASIEVHHGDITAIPVGAIVNAANKHLRHGGGVAGVIARKGGILIQQQSDQWIQEHGPIDHASPAFTTAGKLPGKYVIHAVGPVWGEGEEARKLSDAISSAIRQAEELELSSLSFPAISTGIYGFPVEKAAQIFMRTLHNNLPAQGSCLRRILIVLYDESTLNIFLSAFDAFGWDVAR